MSNQLAEQDILEQLVTAIVMLDGNGRIQYANAAADAMLAGSSRRLLDTPFDSLFSYSSLDFALLYQALAEQQTLSDSDVLLVLHDDKSMTVELFASPCSLPNGTDGSGNGQLLELRQVDLIRRLNQEQTQRQQLIAAQHLVRELAHEIKNPLGGIRGAAQLLQAKFLKADAEAYPEAFTGTNITDYTDLIMTQSDRLRDLVDRLLGPTRPETRRLQNVHEAINHSLDVVALDKPAGIKLIKDFDPSLPELNLAAGQLQQVWLNLLGNAIQALGEQGEVKVRTRVVHQETVYGKRYRQCALISIIDDGPGVPAELKDTLFYPLVSGQGGGNGLGLSIAQSLVHQHAGKIEVQSRPGNTEFIVYLPYTEATA